MSTSSDNRTGDNGNRHRVRHRPRPGACRHRSRHLRRSSADAVPTGAQRLPARRPRQGDLRRLRRRRGVRRDLQPATTTTPTPTPKTSSSPGRSSTTSPGSASRRASRCYASDYFEQLYEWAEHLVVAGPRLRRRPGRRDHLGAARRLRQAGHREPVPRSRRSTRTSTCSGGCEPASSPTARACCAPRSTCSTRTCSCAIR